MDKLKFSKETVSVLKNFNTINSMIYFKKGKVISTISPGKTIFAKYDCEEQFPVNFGIYKLDKLLSILSFFDDPFIVLGKGSLTVVSDKHNAKIAFADPSVLVYPTKEKVDMPSVDVEFDITEEQINAITKAYSVMELPFVSFDGDGEDLKLRALNYKDPTGDSYEIRLDAKTDKKFTALFNINNLKMMPADYHVKVSSKGISEFSNNKMVYWIAVEKDSKFGK